MPAISFQTEWLDKLLSGEKQQTTRPHYEWDAECMACGEMVCEEDIEFERKHKGFHDVDEFYKE